jgi:hypothetical protein
MTKNFCLSELVDPALLRPGDDFSVFRNLGQSVCIKECYRVIHIEHTSKTIEGKLEQRFIGSWEKLPLGRCDLETKSCLFDFNGHHIV